MISKSFKKDKIMIKIKPDKIPVKTHDIIGNFIMLSDEDDLTDKCANKIRKNEKRRIKSKYLKQF